jgi:hypothetical protein
MSDTKASALKPAPVRYVLKRKRKRRDYKELYNEAMRRVAVLLEVNGELADENERLLAFSNDLNEALATAKAQRRHFILTGGWDDYNEHNPDPFPEQTAYYNDPSNDLPPPYEG